MVVKGAPCTSRSSSDGDGGGNRSSSSASSGVSDPRNPDRLESFHDGSSRPPSSSGSQGGLATSTASKITPHMHASQMAQQQRPPRLLLALLRGTEPGSSRSEFAYASSSSKRARLAAKAVAMFLAKTFLGRGGCEANDPQDKRYDKIR